jgi:hypothetical protein
MTKVNTLTCVVLLLMIGGISPGPARGQTIQYVQSSYAVPQSPQTSVSVALATAPATGNLNVVVVGWNDATATVSSVTDSVGNAYALAVGPTILASQATRPAGFP